MRHVPEALQTKLDSGVTTLCTCWIVRRRDEVVLGFTDHDRDLVVEGVTCKAGSGFIASEITSRANLSIDGGEIAGALSDDSLTEGDLAAGLFDAAAIEAWLVDWSDPSLRLLGVAGTIGEVKREGGSFNAEVRGMADALARESGRLYTVNCGADVGDQRCTVDLTSSSAANRFAAQADLVLAPKAGVAIWYDQTSSRWRVAASASSGGGVTGPGSSVDARIAVFSGTSGALLADGGQAIADIAANPTNVAAIVHAATSKATPVDADELPLIDSAASHALKRLTWANLKATAKTYFDTLYSTIIRSINAQTGTSYTLAITDAGNVVTCANAAAIAVTVPPNSSVAFAVGTQIEIIQTGAGAVTLTQGSGVTINSKGSNKKVNGQHVGVTLLKTATDTWQLMGDLTS